MIDFDEIQKHTKLHLSFKVLTQGDNKKDISRRDI